MRIIALLLLSGLFGCAQVPVIETPVRTPLNEKSALSVGEGYLVMGYSGLPNTTIYLRSVQQADYGFKEHHSEHHDYSIKIDDHIDLVTARIPEGTYYISSVSHKPPVGYTRRFPGASSRELSIDIVAGKVNYAGIIGVVLDGMTTEARFYKFDNMSSDKLILYEASPTIASLDWVRFDFCSAIPLANYSCADVTDRYSDMRYFLRYISDKYSHSGDPVRNLYASKIISSTDE